MPNPPRLNPDAARRIGRFVRQGELHPPETKKAAQPTTANIAWHGKFVVTTSTIGAGGAGTLGMGTAKLQLVTRDGDGNATYSATSYDDITVYNGGASIDSGRLCQVKVIDGLMVIDVDYCDAS